MLFKSHSHEDVDKEINKINEKLKELSQKVENVDQRTCKHNYKWWETSLTYHKKCTLCGVSWYYRNFNEWINEKNQNELSEAKKTLKKFGYEVED